MRFLPSAFATISVLGIATAASMDSISTTSIPLGCGAYAGTKEEISAKEARFQELLKEAGNSTLNKFAGAVVQIPVYWNVFYVQNNPSDGNVTDSAINSAVNYANGVLGRDFGIQLVTYRISRYYANYSYVHGASQGNAVEAAMKKLRVGNQATLNIYTVGRNPSNTYGAWATFPSDYNNNPQNDGIVMGNYYLPGVDPGFNGFNSGSLLVHEFGHWLGLFHTFQDGCYGNGDYVNDTPAEAYDGQYQCLNGRDTCAGGGPDPVHNYMDYSSDVCYTQPFTPGQIARVRQQIGYYRGIYI